MKKISASMRQSCNWSPDESEGIWLGQAGRSSVLSSSGDKPPCNLVSHRIQAQAPTSGSAKSHEPARSNHGPLTAPWISHLPSAGEKMTSTKSSRLSSPMYYILIGFICGPIWHQAYKFI